MKIICWWLIVNAAIVLAMLLPPIPWARKKQIELNVMLTTRMIRVRDGWTISMDGSYPYASRIVRRYKLVELQVARAI